MYSLDFPSFLIEIEHVCVVGYVCVLLFTSLPVGQYEVEIPSPAWIIILVFKAAPLVQHSIPVVNHRVRWKHTHFSAFWVRAGRFRKSDGQIALDKPDPLGHSLVEESV